MVNDWSAPPILCLPACTSVAAPSSTGRYAILILEELEYLNHSSSCNYGIVRDHLKLLVKLIFYHITKWTKLAWYVSRMNYCIPPNAQQRSDLASVPPQYKRFMWRKSKLVPVTELPSMVFGIVPLSGTTVDLLGLGENALCRMCMIDLKSYGSPWEVDLTWISNFSPKPTSATTAVKRTQEIYVMGIKSWVYCQNNWSHGS